MGLLSAVWFVSLGLAGVSLLVLAGLIVRRVVDEYGERRRRRLRRDLSEILFTLVEEEPDSSPSNDAEQRQRVLEDLRRFPSEIRRDVIRDLLPSLSGDTHQRLVILAADPLLEDAAIRDLRRGSTRARLAAAHWLAMAGTSRSHGPLQASLRDRIPAVRLAAAEALAVLGLLPDGESLVRYLVADGGLRSRRLVPVFASLASERAAEVTALTAWQADDRELQGVVRRLALQAIAGAGMLAGLDAAMRAAADEDPEVRTQAIRTLGTLGHPRAAEVVLAAFADPVWSVRAQACQAVTRIDIPGARDCLAKALADPESWWVRFRAAEAMFAMGREGQSDLRTIAAGDDAGAAMARSVLLEAGDVLEAG